MSRAASYSTVSGQPKTFAIAGSLLLVSVSYVLLLSAPVITRHLRSVVSGVGGVKTFEWLPLACGAGLVLGGASALVFVLTQIAREAERRPYVCMAPVLAAFSACILIGLRADLPLQGVASEHVAVFGLALSVIGGSLVQTSRVSAQLMGIAFTFLPPLSLFIMLWTVSGKTDPARVVWSLSASARAFLGMLTLSSFAIAGVATLVRQGDRGLSARMPRGAGEQDYVLYDLEADVFADEARLRSRGLPGWAIVLAAAAAIALGFAALKVFLERRPALNFLAPTSNSAAPSSSAPASEPLNPAASADAPAGQQDPEATAPSEPTPSSAPMVVPGSEADNKKTAPAAEQPLREQIAPQAAAPEAASKAASVAASPRKVVARESHKPARKVAHAAPVRAPKVEKPLAVEARGAAREQNKVEKVAPAPRVEKSAPLAAKVEAKLEPKPEAKPVEAKKPEKPKSVGDLALQAADIAAQAGRKGAAKPATELDELMDSALNGKSDKGKKQKMTDDPIYGL
jgi:hypothetical protein